MKYLRYTLYFLITLVVISFITLSFHPGPSLELNTAGQFDYELKNPSEHNQYKKEKTYIEMPDGAQLAANIFIPKGQKEGNFPTIFIYTPYNRSIVIPDMPFWQKCVAKLFTGAWGPVFNAIPTQKAINILTSQGYAIVVADIRGTGASSGYVSIMSPQITEDGINIIEWISQQKWSNGNVGMYGPSYLGWVQLAIAKEAPPALKCINPEIMGTDIYSEAQKPGGILLTKWTSTFSNQLQKLNLNSLEPDAVLPIFPSEPVIDEDGDGEIADEIPLHAGGDPMIFIDDETPTYADGQKREKNIYFNYTKEHQKDIWPASVIDLWTSREAKTTFYGDTLSVRDASPAFFLPAIKESKIPILLGGGWFDGFQGVPKLFANLQNSNPAYLVMVPRFHVPMAPTEPYMELFKYQGKFEDQNLALRIQFFDKYLKGVDNNFEKMAPVQAYTAFKGWDTFQKWPPENAAYQNYYLNDNLQLSSDTNQVNGKETYAVDFSHEAGYDPEGDNRWNMAATVSSLMKRTEHDKKCLVYETPPLESHLQITGHPIVELFLSSNQSDADVFVYLSDVDENGEAIYVTEGQLRAGYHRLVNDDDHVFGDYDFKPNLPWHGYKEEDYEKDPLKDGKILSMRFDMPATSWLFQKGHKLRISIAGADNTNFEFNPTLCPDQDSSKCAKTELNIHRGRGMHSRIELPVVRN